MTMIHTLPHSHTLLMTYSFALVRNKPLLPVAIIPSTFIMGGFLFIKRPEVMPTSQYRLS